MALAWRVDVAPLCSVSARQLEVAGPSDVRRPQSLADALRRGDSQGVQVPPLQLSGSLALAQGARGGQGHHDQGGAVVRSYGACPEAQGLNPPWSGI